MIRALVSIAFFGALLVLINELRQDYDLREMAAK